MWQPTIAVIDRSHRLFVQSRFHAFAAHDVSMFIDFEACSFRYAKSMPPDALRVIRGSPDPHGTDDASPVHSAMQALFVAWYNFARKNEALKNQTPAMASKLTDHAWTIKELVEKAA